MDFAYLHYNVYKTCPLQYRWKFVDKPPFRFTIDKRYAFLGFLLAKLVEKFYLEKWWKEGDPIARMRKAIPVTSMDVQDAEKISLRDEELKGWLDVANLTVPLIVGVIKSEKLLSEHVYVEREEETPFGEDKLQMRPDLMIVRDEVTTLLDGKGGATVGRYVDNDQLYFYAGISEKVDGRLPHRLGFWWFRHGRIVWLPVNHTAVNLVMTQARIFIDCIKEKRFEPNPGPHCRLCDFRVGCDAGQKFIAERWKVCDAEIPESGFGEVSF